MVITEGGLFLLTILERPIDIMKHPYKTREGGATVTIFVPYDCKNHCPFCINKEEYGDMTGFSLEKIVESIRRITAQTLYDCHKAFYTPANMCLVVVGDVDPEEVLRAAREVLPRESGPAIPRDYGREEDLTPHMARIEDRMEGAMPTFLLGFKCPPVPEGEERMRLDILGDLACDVLMGESSPLFTRLYSQGLINGTFDSAYDLLPGAAYVFCGGDSNDPEAVQQAVLDEARRVVREGVDPAYVQRIRRASFGASMNSFEAIASTAAEGCFQGYDPFRFPEVYDSITQQDLLDFIRDNIRPERMALSIIYPKE
mgnify:CR=1 FL=1